MTTALLSLALLLLQQAHPRGAPDWFGRALRESVVRDSNLVDARLDGTSLFDVRFVSCSLRTREWVHDARWERVQIDQSWVEALAFNGGEVKQLTISESQVGELDLRSVRSVSLRLENSTVGLLRISGGNATEIVIIGGRVDRIVIQGVGVGRLMFAGVSVGQVHVMGGGVDVLQINEIGKVSEFALRHVNIRVLDLSLQAVDQIDIAYAHLADREFRLQQERMADEEAYGSRRASELYREAQGIYAALAEQFRFVGLAEAQRQMEFRMHEVERKAATPLRSAFSWVLHLQMRGHYGASPLIVLRSMTVVLVLFALLYFFLGLIRVAWGGVVPTTLLGDSLDEARVRILVRPKRGQWSSYSWAALGFSADRLFFVGTRPLYADQLFESMRIIPKRYVGVGFGRLIAGVESVVGLVLIVFFVQAFVRTI